ncbi:MAG: N-acetylneuraminate synthase family protein [Chloroflexota bacterium]
MTNNGRVHLGRRTVGEGEPVYIIAEIGINHNGSLDLARKLIDGAIFAGADAVKFQKRTPELCVPRDQWDLERDTPWGRITYLDYRHKVEFTYEQYRNIDRYCRARGLDWFASCWDEEAVDFMERFDTPLYKVASATLTDRPLLEKLRRTGKPLMLSTGMSEMWQIHEAVDLVSSNEVMIAHATSSYPCPPEELNLRMITTLKETFPGVPIGYSGHEVGLAPTWAAVTLGASFVERHITVDRAMWGSDQAASVEVMGFHNLARNIRDIEQAMGDGIKRIYPSERAAMKKLRRVQTEQPSHASS